METTEARQNRQINKKKKDRERNKTESNEIKWTKKNETHKIGMLNMTW